jgi:hypothetical protein
MVSESRVALRACDRSQEAAVTYLINKREQQRAAREEERRQREARRERHRAGKTANGQWVDVALLKALTDMGFTRRLATEALRQSNNDEAASITLLTESPDVLQASIDASRNKKSKRKATPTPVPEDKIEQVRTRACGCRVRGFVCRVRLWLRVCGFVCAAHSYNLRARAGGGDGLLACTGRGYVARDGRQRGAGHQPPPRGPRH